MGFNFELALEQRDMIDANFRASALILKLTVPKPPFKIG